MNEAAPDPKRPVSDPSARPGGHDTIIAALEQRTGSKIHINLLPKGDDRTPVVRLSKNTDSSGQDKGFEELIGARYRIEGEIARGGVGIVYKAKDVDLGRDVALKILHERFNERSDILQRFIEEAQIGGQLQHPGIVPVYEIGVCADKRPFIAMKLVKGETLAAQLERRNGPTEDRQRILGIFAQICHTVAYGHDRRVVHRDLKPSNVMVGAFGEVQIVDWGFAKVLGAGGIEDEAKSQKGRSGKSVVETLRSQARGSELGSDSQVGSAIGTPAYMPPEQARGEVDDMDARSDVFALGAVLCEILTGSPPYVKNDKDDRDELLVQAAQCQLEDAKHRLQACEADPQLVSLCRDCLSPSRQARPQDAAKVAARITDYLTHVEQRARDAEVLAASARVRTKCSYALLASVLLTVVVAGAAWYYIRGENARRLQQDSKDYHSAIALAVRLRHKAAQTEQDSLGLWNKALYSARRARDRAHSAGLGKDSITAAESLMQTLEEQRRIALREQDEKQLLTDLEELRIPQDEDVHGFTWMQRRFTTLDEGYARIFKSFGVDVDRLSPDEAAALLAGSRSTELGAILDHWSLVRRYRHNAEPQSAGVAASEKRVLAQPKFGDWRHVQRVARHLDPKDTWRNDLRDCLASSGRPDSRAVQALRKAASFEHMPAVSVILLSAVLRATQDHEGALDVLRAGQRYHPRDFDLNFKLGLFLELATPPRWHEAAQYYLAAMTLRPKMARLALRLAFVTARGGDHQQSLAWRKRAIELNPNLAEANAALGAEFVRRGQMKNGMFYMSKSLKIAPNHPVANWGMAGVLRRQGRLDAAIKHLERATQLRPDFLQAEVDLGKTLQLRGRVEAAEKIFRRIAMNPSKMEWLQSLGVTLTMGGQGKKAIAGRSQLTTIVHAVSRKNPNSALKLANGLFDDRGYASAANVFSTTFRVRPELCVGENRYRAACAAAMAGSGKGKNPSFAPAESRPRLREQARKWLRAALADRATDQRQLRRWQRDRRLAFVRVAHALEKLPLAEAKAWRSFWIEVAEKAK